MYIAGVTVGKHASVCLLKDGEIVFFIEEERLSRKKRDDSPFLALTKIKEYTDKLDYLAISESNVDAMPTIKLAKKLKLIDNDNQVLTNNQEYTHHLFHAASAFYTSGFTDAVCVVIDSQGSWIHDHSAAETESIFTFEYPAKATVVYKRLANSLNRKVSSGNIEVNSDIGIGKMYSAVSSFLGFRQEPGKTMGLSSYGQPDSSLPPFYINGAPNRNLFIPVHDNDYMRRFPSIAAKFDINLDNPNRENLSYAIQNATEEKATEYVVNALRVTGKKNLVISGGYGLNCVANYEFLNHIPNDVKVHVDPVAYDGGQSIGIAKFFHHIITNDNTLRKQQTYNLGPKPEYNLDIGDDATYSDVVKLLLNKNIVAIFQGSSEAGPRALGNRSILFDPRVPNGKEIVNTIKGREAFRPFAASILKECANEWFDMRGLDETPFMMYAVNALSKAKEQTPCIVHADNTCRLQTVDKDQNLHYYNLISEFYKETGVPLLFNTSFNLAGDPIVETLEDAIDTLKRSKIEFLFLPEKQKLIRISNDNKTF